MIKDMACFCSNELIYIKAYVPGMDFKYPTIIMSHGFCVNHTYFEYYANELLKHDVASILFDFRGGDESNKSGGNLYTTSVLTEVDDLSAVLDTVQNYSFVDKNNIYLLGHSQGAFVSSIVASNQPDLIKSLFLLAPAFLIPEQMKKAALPKGNTLKDNTVGVVSRKYIQDARKIDVDESIQGYTKCVYIFHGSDDKAVPVGYSKHAVDVYKNAKLKVLDNQRHNFRTSAKDLVINDVIQVIKGNLND